MYIYKEHISHPNAHAMFINHAKKRKEKLLLKQINEQKINKYMFF